MQVLTSESSPIWVNNVSAEAVGLPGRLGLTLAPGKQGKGWQGLWQRDLDLDLMRLREEFYTALLVSLIEIQERAELRIVDLPERTRKSGIEFVQFPMVDGNVPASPEKLHPVITKILETLAAGKNVVAHCKGGLGRSGLVVACTLVARGHSSAQAIELVREARRGAVENTRQEQFVEKFARYWEWHGDRG